MRSFTQNPTSLGATDGVALAVGLILLVALPRRSTLTASPTVVEADEARDPAGV